MPDISKILDAIPDVHVLIFCILGVVGFIVLVILTVWLRRAMRRWRFGDRRGSILHHWTAVEELAERGDAMSLRLAIIQADAVLDLALKTKAFPGTTTGERLKFASRKYRKLNNTFWARSLRNTLVHEAGSELNIAQGHKAIAEFKEALIVMGAL